MRVIVRKVDETTIETTIGRFQVGKASNEWERKAWEATRIGSLIAVDLNFDTTKETIDMQIKQDILLSDRWSLHELMQNIPRQLGRKIDSKTIKTCEPDDCQIRKYEICMDNKCQIIWDQCADNEFVWFQGKSDELYELKMTLTSLSPVKSSPPDELIGFKFQEYVWWSNNIACNEYYRVNFQNDEKQALIWSQIPDGSKVTLQLAILIGEKTTWLPYRKQVRSDGSFVDYPRRSDCYVDRIVSHTPPPPSSFRYPPSFRMVVQKVNDNKSNNMFIMLNHHKEQKMECELQFPFTDSCCYTTDTFHRLVFYEQLAPGKFKGARLNDNSISSLLSLKEIDSNPHYTDLKPGSIIVGIAEHDKFEWEHPLDQNTALVKFQNEATKKQWKMNMHQKVRVVVSSIDKSDFFWIVIHSFEVLK